jgi:hypothetical protein
VVILSAYLYHYVACQHPNKIQQKEDQLNKVHSVLVELLLNTGSDLIWRRLLWLQNSQQTPDAKHQITEIRW